MCQPHSNTGLTPRDVRLTTALFLVALVLACWFGVHGHPDAVSAVSCALFGTLFARRAAQARRGLVRIHTKAPGASIAMALAGLLTALGVPAWHAVHGDAAALTASLPCFAALAVQTHRLGPLWPRPLGRRHG